MNRTIYILLVFLLRLLTVTSTTADSPLPPPSPTNCSDELVTFSTCLPYVAVSPNNLTESPSPQCCDDISAAFTSGSAVCLCYFFRRPKILGFPLNSTKLMSLISVCPLKDQNSNATFSLDTLCSAELSGSAPLPPLQSITGPFNSKPSNFSVESLPPPSIGSLEYPGGSSSNPKPADEAPTLPRVSTFPAIISSAAERLHKISLCLLTLLVHVFAFASRESILSKNMIFA